MHLLSGPPPEQTAEPARAPGAVPAAEASSSELAALKVDVARLQAEVAGLKALTARLCAELGIADGA